MSRLGTGEEALECSQNFLHDLESCPFTATTTPLWPGKRGFLLSRKEVIDMLTEAVRLVESLLEGD